MPNISFVSIAKIHWFPGIAVASHFHRMRRNGIACPMNEGYDQLQQKTKDKMRQLQVLPASQWHGWKNSKFPGV